MRRWHEGMVYAFAVNRATMRVCGNWPFRRKFFFHEVRWISGTLLEFTIAISVILELALFTDKNALRTLETVVVMYCSVLHLFKNTLFRIHLNKLRRNIKAANADWQFAVKDRRSYFVMKKYARLGSFVNWMLLSSGYGALVVYLSFMFASQALSNPPEGTTRNFLISLRWLPETLTDLEYGAVIVTQIVQTSAMITRQCIIDGFYFSLVMHVCGQLDILTANFRELGTRVFTKLQYRKRTGSLVRRHCQLLKLIENIEATYNVIILLQVVSSAILIGATGYRFTWSIKIYDRMLTLRCVFLISFFTLQTLIYAYGGERLQTENEKMQFDMYNASWEVLPRKRAKDLIFVMMRTNVPVRITGGKFFRISCKTMMGILRGALSYVSLLQASIKG